MDIIKIHAEKKNISINMSNENTDDIIISADSKAVTQVMLNLLSNAVKFTNDNGNIQIILRKNDSYCFITVKDDGIGIDRKFQNVIFEKFTQADSRLDRPTEGTGLGLTITKNLVEKMGGHIYLESELGSGSAFTITLPLDNENHENPVSIYAETIRTLFYGKSVLIITDSEDSKCPLCSMLKNESLEHIVKKRDAIASSDFRKENLCAVIIWVDKDIDMEKEFLETIKNIRKLPVIAVVNSSLFSREQDYIECGFDYVLFRPIDLKSFIAFFEKSFSGEYS